MSTKDKVELKIVKKQVAERSTTKQGQKRPRESDKNKNKPKKHKTSHAGSKSADKKKKPTETKAAVTQPTPPAQPAQEAKEVKGTAPVASANAKTARVMTWEARGGTGAGQGFETTCKEFPGTEWSVQTALAFMTGNAPSLTLVVYQPHPTTVDEAVYRSRAHINHLHLAFNDFLAEAQRTRPADLNKAWRTWKQGPEISISV